jgi:hypothetical protein
MVEAKQFTALAERGREKCQVKRAGENTSSARKPIEFNKGFNP